jgi:hypothetical protein
VKTISGWITSTGSVGAGSGFTDIRNSTGNYTISFPAGTWSGTTTPIMVVTPAGQFGAIPIAQVSAFDWFPDGSASFTIQIDGVQTATAQDNDFLFTATQS